MNRQTLLVLCAVLTGCSSAPYSNETTARSLGKNNWSTQFGATSALESFAGVYFRQGYGILDDWDLGVDAETTSRQMGVWTRYSFMNPVQEGFALALVGGAGAGSNQTYNSESDSTVYNAYLGPMMSYKKSAFEGYTQIRANYLYSSDTINDGNSFEEEFIYELFYGTYSLGGNIWFNKYIAFTADANIMFKLGDEDPISDPYFNVGLLFRY